MLILPGVYMFDKSFGCIDDFGNFTAYAGMADYFEYLQVIGHTMSDAFTI